jgi:alpha-glucosidase
VTEQFKWWQKGIVYQIYPRSFQDTNRDGIGDLRGIIERLDYLNDGTEQSLGIDAIWISPFFPSPMADFGYDVADYCNVDPMFGNLDDFDRLIAAAHAHNIRVIIDWVPNHTSDQHPWFIESRSSRDNPKRDWYIWRDAGENGALPNNWGSVFGGPAWTWDEQTQQYYFHQFIPGQPDLNWRNPEVRAAMLDTLRFWLNRGVDGFRMDVIYMIWKHPDMPDQPWDEQAKGRGEYDLYSRQRQIYSMNYDGIHEIIKQIRGVLDEFGDDKLMIGEIWLPLEERLKYHGENGDEFHMPFNFDFITQGSVPNDPISWNAATYRTMVDRYEAACPPGGWPNYVLGNHDLPRLISRIGGVERAKLAAMMLLTLRGTPTIYMGEELGMVNGEIRPEQMQDPQGINLGIEHTRDVCRTPMQWDSSFSAGFSGVNPWLPVHSNYAQVNAAVESNDLRSMLSFYRSLIHYRRQHSSLAVGSYQSLEVGQDIYAFLRTDGAEQHLIALNFAEKTAVMELPQSGKIMLSTSQTRKGEVIKTLTLAANEGVVIALNR